MSSWRKSDQKIEEPVEMPAEGEPLTDEQFRFKHRIKVNNI